MSETRWQRFECFDGVVLDLQRFVMLDDSGNVVLDNGMKVGVGREAADAIRRRFNPTALPEPSSGTGDTGREVLPGSSSASGPSPESESSSVRARLLVASCGVTSFPGQDAPAGSVADAHGLGDGNDEATESTESTERSGR